MTRNDYKMFEVESQLDMCFSIQRSRDANGSTSKQNYGGFGFDSNYMVLNLNSIPTRNLLNGFDYEKNKYIKSFETSSNYSSTLVPNPKYIYLIQILFFFVRI